MPQYSLAIPSRRRLPEPGYRASYINKQDKLLKSSYNLPQQTGYVLKTYEFRISALPLNYRKLTKRTRITKGTKRRCNFRKTLAIASEKYRMIFFTHDWLDVANSQDDWLT